MRTQRQTNLALIMFHCLSIMDNMRTRGLRKWATALSNLMCLMKDETTDLFSPTSEIQSRWGCSHATGDSWTGSHESSPVRNEASTVAPLEPIWPRPLWISSVSACISIPPGILILQQDKVAVPASSGSLTTSPKRLDGCQCAIGMATSPSWQW